MSRLSSLFANLSRGSAGNLLIRPTIFVIEWPLHITNYRGEDRYQDSSSLEKRGVERGKNREKKEGVKGLKKRKKKKNIQSNPSGSMYIYIIASTNVRDFSAIRKKKRKKEKERKKKKNFVSSVYINFTRDSILMKCHLHSFASPFSPLRSKSKRVNCAVKKQKEK